MAIRVALNHRTSYHYDREVALGPQVVRLRPAPHTRTPILSYSLKVSPNPHFENWQQDPQGNYLARYIFPNKTHSFEIEVDLIAELTVINPFDFFLEADAEESPFVYAPALAHEIGPYRRVETGGPKFAEFVASFDITKRRTIDFLVDLNMKVHKAVGYTIRLEPGIQTCEETLTKCSGSCRDSAWLLVQALRSLGFAARFVSGYLIQLKADVKSLDGPSGAAEDFTDLHAWSEVYLPGAGWVGLDPTSGLFTGEGHIPLAATPDPQSAAPVTGGVDECETTFGFHMSVTRVHEDPRVTKPYTEEQWVEIQAMGRKVDQDLKRHDVRLTMGGEPTFVSIDDMDGDEWNTAALGKMKRQRAGELLRKMHARFAPGGMLHFGQGKWYPGESLPRWALGCWWRRDGQPIWRDQALVADERSTTQHGAADAQRFIVALAEKLNVGGEHAIPAYEDIWYYLWKERRLPTNVDPLESKLENKEDRLRLARIFEKGLSEITGYVLPLRRRPEFSGILGEQPQGWVSGRWFFRQEHMFLFPGDSPIGYRLPLDSLPWTAADDQEKVIELDPFVARSPIGQNQQQRLREPAGLDKALHPFSTGFNRIVEQVFEPAFASVEGTSTVTSQARRGTGGWFGGEGGGNGDGSGHGDSNGHHSSDQGPFNYDETWEKKGRSAMNMVRTALCVEPREGRLHIFMPPVGLLEDYLELVTAIEDTARELSLPVALEGYTPPGDPRTRHFKITPDPGVIEVNVQPGENWEELVDITTGLYEDAFTSRLGTEKFMLDGRHTGTGGGNHVVLGGATPIDSPFLRRPDLLRSLVSYWHNHPSLSYLFSGTFLGPTSQAPRIDEARNDAVYELELAFKQIPKNGYCPPWLVDRIFRHLLVDITGNTHRAEFCIDKLFSPDSSSGRLGLVEFRGFEMPPHARMSLTQQLLIRSLVARFWDRPYEARLVRWGTGLHDRFMLPHYIESDFADVIDDLQQEGFPLKAEWFAPHLEFRFPIHGRLAQQDVELELRQAIEPWHVLGEEVTGSGTARYVDSSVERLQVKVRGMVESRHVVTANGRRVPLFPTGTVGEFVAGVRYRAWQPPSCLHPTIPPHTPLVFDLVDTWLGRSLGGCSYNVSHPGGLSHERFPVNAFEAESRRVARFKQFGHTPGKMVPAEEPVNREFPSTLDLRT